MAYTTIDDPTIYFNTKLFTGNGGTNAITGVGHQPDWVWLKNRTDGDGHKLFDSIRGALKVISANETDAESTYSNSLASFDSDGFTVGSTADINESGDNIVSWNWKAGGSASSNSNGDITSSVSANQNAGFSIVSYTGSGVFQNTVGHGLGAVPKMIIVKRRSDSREWIVYHSSLGNTKKIHLNDTSAEVTQPAWGNTTPTSSVFTVSGASQTNWFDTNQASGTYIAYCFAEKKGYSKFGSYTGNGNANGTFIFTGFRVSWLMIKRTDSANSWIIMDTKRTTSNPMGEELKAEVSDAGNVATRWDQLSNGFKLRNAGGAVNASGGTYIYMAFAESPFVTSTGIPTTAR